MKDKLDNDRLEIVDAPPITGLSFRRFRGKSDFPSILAVLQSSREADQIEWVDTVESLAVDYETMPNCNLYQDLLIVEVDGVVIGSCLVNWREVPGDVRQYFHTGSLLPEWRRKGIGTAMLRYNERRLREIAASLPASNLPGFFQTIATNAQTGKTRLFEREGYTPARYSYEMVRPDLENIPDCAMPPGLEIRPVLPAHMREIWEAEDEAMQDHWSHPPQTEEDYQFFLHSQYNQPEIWKVAWDSETGQVAGMVLGFIVEEQNVKFHRKRGWTENISVRRPWRKRGLARALIAENLRELKQRGMTEAALHVDTENLSGALSLYESMGFRAAGTIFTIYRKNIAF